MQTKGRTTAIITDLLETALIAGAIFAVIYFFLFKPFQVNGSSMEPTYTDGEYVLTNVISMRFHAINRGDVIVFEAPPNERKDFIKRVIGLPGETVMLQEGSVYVNGKRLNESAYLPPDLKTYGRSFLKEGEKVTVPTNEYFVLGDNREYSSDSREWGFVPEDKIIGKTFVIYWPPKNFRITANAAHLYE